MIIIIKSEFCLKKADLEVSSKQAKCISTVFGKAVKMLWLYKIRNNWTAGINGCETVRVEKCKDH